ncbi:hypothetical protein POM88_024075 [Heracleum sosnowskyi]|uniref:Uncharacterized protein n=1 Tax=Heracleum sosnowskyi TaxID=360622 RepID=A0AAD8MR26_9APIA|nr:hypothetical protein POM88_024075 [Heracleum sosnowskyi]
MKEGQQSIIKDFLDVVLDFEGSGKDEPAKLSHLQISIFLVEMFMAGTETTSSTTECKIYSSFEQQIVIYVDVEEFPDWIIQSSVQGSVVEDETVEISSSVNLQPNLSQNYYEPDYSVMTSASNIFGPGIVIVPRSIFTVTDADHTIKFTSKASKHWIHLLYKNEDDNTTVNVEDERNTLSASDLEVEDGGTLQNA